MAPERGGSVRRSMEATISSDVSFGPASQRETHTQRKGGVRETHELNHLCLYCPAVLSKFLSCRSYDTCLLPKNLFGYILQSTVVKVK